MKMWMGHKRSANGPRDCGKIQEKAMGEKILKSEKVRYTIESGDFVTKGDNTIQSA